MAIQVLGAGPQKKTFGQKLNEGIGRGLSLASEMAREQEMIKFQEREQENLSRFMQEEYGMDTSHLPLEFQKEILKGEYGLRGKKLSTLNKSPPGGLTGQPIPKEISNAMSHIVSINPNASADELKMQMDEAGVPPAYSNQYIENRRRSDERMSASHDKRLEAGQKRAEKILDEADVLGKELPLVDSHLFAMEDAIQNEDLSFWSPDNLAEMTGIEALRTAKGAQFKSAGKKFFIDDLKASGARPNQFIEQQFVDALTKVGRSREANQTVLESFKFTNDLRKKRHETIRALEKYYYESMGYMPGNFGSIVEETISPYVKERQKQYEDTLKDLSKSEKSSKKQKPQKLSGKLIDVMGPDGQMYEVDESEVSLLPEGYRIQ